MDGPLQDRFIAERFADPIARLIVRPVVLAGRNGDLADLDVMRARRAKIDELILMSLHLSIHTEHVREIEVDWDSQCVTGAEAVTAMTLAGSELHAGDWRIRALRALSAKAIMAICDY